MSGIHQTKQGFWVLNDDPYISTWTEQLGRLDHDRTIDMLCSLIPVGGVAVDAGAAIGDHTVFYGHRVGPTGRVLAFEPNPDAFACMVMNTREQPWVEPFRMALSGDAHTVAMEYKPDNIWASCVMDPTVPGQVPALPLDYLVNILGLRRLDFVKIDVEGFEPEVIYGALESIKRFRPAIAAEINKGALKKFGWSPEADIYRPLFDLGYELKMIDPTHTLDLPQFDCLFMP